MKIIHIPLSLLLVLFSTISLCATDNAVQAKAFYAKHKTDLAELVRIADKIDKDISVQEIKVEIDGLKTPLEFNKISFNHEYKDYKRVKNNKFEQIELYMEHIYKDDEQYMIRFVSEGDKSELVNYRTTKEMSSTLFKYQQLFKTMTYVLMVKPEYIKEDMARMITSNLRAKDLTRTMQLLNAVNYTDFKKLYKSFYIDIEDLKLRIHYKGIGVSTSNQLDSDFSWESIGEEDLD